MIHDTKHPLDCCDRCRTAEIGRRSHRSPNVRYSQSAKSGVVIVVHGPTTVATLRKSEFGRGWYVADAIAPLARLVGAGDWGLMSRREALDDVVAAYTSAWRAGFDPTSAS